MRVSSVLAAVVATASSACASVQIMRLEAADIDWKWSVTNWNAGCSSGGCYYDFNVTGIENDSKYPKRPGFKAYCSGGDEGGEYRECKLLEKPEVDAAVAAKLLPRTETSNGSVYANIEVTLQHTDLDVSTTWWNYTGHGRSFYNQFVAPGQKFPVTIDELIGVA